MKLMLLGSSGHAGVIVDAIEASGQHEILGYLDDTLAANTVKRGYPVMGGFADRTHFPGVGLVLAFGDNFSRRKIARNIPDGVFPLIQHPSAVVARSATIARGSVLLAGVVVGAGSKVGEFCVLNTRATLDHDSVMSPFSSLGPGTSTGGLVEIGECSAVGVGVSISDRIRIDAHSVIGTGAVVVRDIPDHVVAYGVPARVMHSRQEGEGYVGTNPRLQTTH